MLKARSKTILGVDMGVEETSEERLRRFTRHLMISICSYLFSCKMFGKSVFFVYSHLEHGSDEKKGIAFFSNSLNL